MDIEVLCLFPELVRQVIDFGMPRRAVETGALRVSVCALRDYAQRSDGRIDDRSYGGGPGMVLQAEPVVQAIAAARARLPQARVVALSPQGEPLTQAWVWRLSREPELIMLCGRYEGVDERASRAVDLEVSLGDYVLSGGELAAMVVVDAIARLLPGVLGEAASAQAESFEGGLLDHAHYSRPPRWREQPVPEVLLSGDHRAVRRWRLRNALATTWMKRPDLLAGLNLDEEQRKLLREFIAEAVRDGEEVEREQDHSGP
ncbi:MAG: tRNA (guanosine(37)-N1)-methyltransferase TrmD [Gammaproteobacteria bacterium]|nr:tRNA (guanosine(37)-N1)-methyltransferase TrmD [Gammaproteobacteria bacterium]